MLEAVESVLSAPCAGSSERRATCAVGAGSDAPCAVGRAACAVEPVAPEVVLCVLEPVESVLYVLGSSERCTACGRVL